LEYKTILNALITSLLIVITILYLTKRRNNAALNGTNISNTDNTESVGTLVDMLNDGDGSCERKCREALIRLLPLLSEENAHLLDEYRQAKLRYVVWPPASPIYSTYLARLARNSPQSIALRIGIVQALSRVGDGEALTMFNEMLDCNAYTVNERRIQQVVRESRPALVDRVAAQPARQSLLRPSTRTDTHSLLRIPVRERDLSSQDMLHVHE
jgi:hypothetical protein